MQTYGLVPGCQYLYKTSWDDTVLVRLPAEGLLGVVGKKKQWIVTRRDPSSLSKCCAEMVVCSPAWAVENGSVEAAQAELNQWMYPELSACERMWDEEC